MPCVVCTVDFFVFLAVPAFAGLAVTVLSVILANRRESGATSGLKVLKVYGFFSEGAYADPRARAHMRRARLSWWVGMAFFGLLYFFVALLYLTDICRACPGVGP